MSRLKREAKAKEISQQVVDKFNQMFPVGTKVQHRTSTNAEYKERIVERAAYIASSLDPVAFFEGLSGYYLVTKDFVKY